MLADCPSERRMRQLMKKRTKPVEKMRRRGRRKKPAQTQTALLVQTRGRCDTDGERRRRG
ncbi:uncharacterized protein B0H18DRAFT_1018358 [Fomitopsis serialis]|uniref:uncharacterized protein n=1 Tax=Fomitopsis serialis TaxID=139415 RepID=UPI0020088EBF|nr:uncharacterized protein B0H18DRAFT_1018358 [Neoantrodia serialis]KAH9922170.1 hypothetical protein B0H18DRAFT_1018358 [Neoantrodia serialis]